MQLKLEATAYRTALRHEYDGLHLMKTGWWWRLVVAGAQGAYRTLVTAGGDVGHKGTLVRMHRYPAGRCFTVWCFTVW